MEHQEVKQVRLNGTWTATPANTVVDLLLSVGIDPTRGGAAVAVNGEVVLRSRWPEEVLNEGDKVEILRPVQGG